MRNEQKQAGYAFGPFRLDMRRRRLLREGVLVPLQPKDFETLLVLVQQAAQVVAKEELIALLWPDAIVEEANLSQHIYVLRKALGEGAQDYSYIVTVPGRGYRFTAPVREWSETEGAQLAPQREAEISAPLPSPPHWLARLRTRQRRHWRLLLTAFVLLGGMTALLSWWYSRPKPNGLGKSVHSIAVLPFQSLGTERQDAVLGGLGIADALINRLANLGQITVRPTSAIQKYAGNATDPLVVGKEQEVDAVLVGHTQRDGEQVRVTVQLIGTPEQATLWTAQFDEPVTDLFQIQNAVAAQVAQTLIFSLTGEEAPKLAKRDPISSEAYQAYIQGRRYWNQRTVLGFQKAQESFTRAIQLEPNYASAYAGLADVYIAYGVATEAKAAALKALALDDNLAEAHASLAMVRFWYEWDWNGAGPEFKRAMEIQPGYATARQWYAYFAAVCGLPDLAIYNIKLAQNIDPASLIINADVGEILFYLRRYDDALAHLQRVVAQSPNFARARRHLGRVYEQKGMYAEALTEFQKFQALENVAGIPEDFGSVYARMGKQDEAQKIISSPEISMHLSLYGRAMIYSSLGDKEQVIFWLEKGYQEHAPNLFLIGIEPRFDPLRSDPKFLALLQRLQLPH
ncbi:MAG: winged helix-turn-helix domain-containing protein [Acidobacteria bacterium]|nr:winged helix-turn-helix domain-containing protein [Acidobacteriota bacterium]